MSIQKVPRAGFGMDCARTGRLRRELARLLGRHLRKSFDSIRVYPRYFFPISQVVLRSGGHGFVVSVGREKLIGKDEGDWYVVINLLGYPVPLKSLPKDVESKYAKDLMRISEEIHAILSSVSGITRLRWYFEGWDVNIPGVRTSAELPWHADAPKPHDAVSEKMS